MRTLQVDLGERSYPILIGPGLLANLQQVGGWLAGSQVLIVTNTTIAPLYLSAVEALFTGCQCDSVVLPDGERYKTLETLNLVFDCLLSRRHSRATTLVALGGGVVGDLTGFAAACYQRGVSFIQIPTTLLAQVDSSVGGKTGVNHPLGKNMIGAFHQPVGVVIDTDTLATLPEREFRSGLAEVVKYGLITDVAFFQWLEQDVAALLSRNADALAYAIEKSCATKAEVVAQDERESGQRALLNLGHTFGHAMETWLQYEGLLHGEAVAAGTVMAAELSALIGLCAADVPQRVRQLFQRLGLPVVAPVGMKADDFIELMLRDKKVLDGRMRLILLEEIGKAVICDTVGASEIVAAVHRCQA